MYEIIEEKDGKFICTGGWCFDSREQAQEFCGLWNEHFTVMARLNDVPAALSREEYEVTARRIGVEVMSDSECDSYGVRYGEFGPYFGGCRMEKYTPTFCLKMALARRRLSGIEGEKKARSKKTRQPDYPKGRELSCGCIVYYKSEVMSASLGSSCAGCYDRMSD